MQEIYAYKQAIDFLLVHVLELLPAIYLNIVTREYIERF